MFFVQNKKLILRFLAVFLLICLCVFLLLLNIVAWIDVFKNFKTLKFFLAFPFLVLLILIAWFTVKFILKKNVKKFGFIVLGFSAAFILFLVIAKLTIKLPLIIKNIEIEKDQIEQKVNTVYNTIPSNYPDFQEDINDNLNINLDKIKYFNDYASYLSLDDEAKQGLSKYGFTVQNSKFWDSEFFFFYKANEFNKYSNFITTDSVLHITHKTFESIMKRSEEEIFLPILRNIINSGLSQAKVQYNLEPNSDYNKICYLYFLVAAKLLNFNIDVPSNLVADLNQEMDLIEKGNQIISSVILNLDNPDKDNLVKLDYSQFTVRGYYTENENLKRYFKGYMWLSLPTINLKSERGMQLSQKLVKIITSNQQTSNEYKKLSLFVSFFTNIAANVSLNELSEINYNPGDSLDPIIEKLLKKKDNPLVSNDDYLVFSYLPKASLFDNYIFENSKKEELEKIFPSTIEIPTAFGSEEAKNIAKKIGFGEIYNNEEYLTSLGLLRDNILGKENNFYSRWMVMLNPLLNYPDKKYIFSSTKAWLRKELVTYLASWTELRHSMALYSYTSGAGGGGEPPDRDDRGLVEPYPEVYKQISLTIDYLFNYFQKNNLLDVKSSQNLENLQLFIRRIEEIAQKEISQQTLSASDYDFIRSYGDEYEKLWLNTFSEEQIKNSGGVADLAERNPAALIMDVYANKEGEILHTGNGFPQHIAAIFELDGELRIAVGEVYSNYEFRQQNKRLTDNEWREMLRSSTEDENFTNFQITPWQRIYQYISSNPNF